MSISLNVNGTNYNFPVEDDENWGEQVTAWASAITNGMLQKQGGNFFLTQELDFGSSYGVKTKEITIGNTKVTGVGNYTFDLPPTAGTTHDVLLLTGEGDTVFGRLSDSSIAIGANIALSKLNPVTADKVLISDNSGVIVPSTVDSSELPAIVGLATFRTNVNDSISGLINDSVFKAGDQTITGIKTFSNTIKAEKAVTSTPVEITASEVDWSQGSVFYKTLTSNTTLTFANAGDGQSILLDIDCNSLILQLPTILWAGAEVPSFSGRCLIFLMKRGSSIFGSATLSHQ